MAGTALGIGDTIGMTGTDTATILATGFRFVNDLAFSGQTPFPGGTITGQVSFRTGIGQGTYLAVTIAVNISNTVFTIFTKTFTLMGTAKISNC